MEQKGNVNKLKKAQEAINLHQAITQTLENNLTIDAYINKFNEYSKKNWNDIHWDKAPNKKTFGITKLINQLTKEESPWNFQTGESPLSTLEFKNELINFTSFKQLKICATQSKNLLKKTSKRTNYINEFLREIYEANNNDWYEKLKNEEGPLWDLYHNSKATDEIRAIIKTFITDVTKYQITKTLEKNKENWKQEFENQFKNILNSDDAIRDAINGRLSLTKEGKQVTLTNAISNVDELSRALKQIDADINSSEYALYDPGRLGNQLRAAGFSEEEIKKMKKSDILKYEAVIGSCTEELFQKLAIGKHYTEIMLKTNNTDIQTVIQNDQNDFKNQLAQLTKPFILKHHQEVVARERVISSNNTLNDSQLKRLKHIIDETINQYKEIKEHPQLKRMLVIQSYVNAKQVLTVAVARQLLAEVKSFRAQLKEQLISEKKISSREKKSQSAVTTGTAAISKMRLSTEARLFAELTGNNLKQAVFLAEKMLIFNFLLKTR